MRKQVGEFRVTRLTIGVAAAVSISVVPAIAQTSDPSCLSEQEFADALLILAPMALKSIGDQCSAVLRKGLVLGNPQSTVATKLDEASRKAWPRALPAIMRVMKSQGEQLNLGDSTMTQETFNAGMAPSFKKIITDLGSCEPVDKMLKLAEPLPPQNLSGILVQILRISPAGKSVKVLCPPRYSSRK